MFVTNTTCFADIDTISDFNSFIAKNVESKFLKSFTTQHTFNETDQVLQNVGYWPKISDVDYFKSKLKFQIRHSLFRFDDILLAESVESVVTGPRYRRGTRPLGRSWTGTRRSTARHSPTSPTPYTTPTYQTFTGEFIQDYHSPPDDMMLSISMLMS